MVHPFTGAILEWYDPERRPLPWKKDRNPYHTFLSEIILQQTRVEQGMPYYHRFVEKFPAISDLANASEDDVMKHWEGLGYYSRARNLHAAAKQVMNEFGGAFPSTYASILSLKGVGPYTAAAIASFAFDEPHAVVDGNVYRVLARYFGCKLAIDMSVGKKYFTELAQSLLPGQSAVYNQAIMDLGAMVCTPRQARCSDCPLQTGCKAYADNEVYSYPVKAKKLIRRDRFLHYLVPVVGECSTVIRQREKGDIWAGLYEFPMLESDSEWNQEQALLAFEKEWEISANRTTLKHVRLKQDLTHRRIHANFYSAEVHGHIPGIPVKLESIERFPFPKILREFNREFHILGK